MKNTSIIDIIYKDAVKCVVMEFMEKLINDKESFDEFDYDNEIEWVNESYDVFIYGDYYINLSDVIIDLKRDVAQGVYLDWYSNASIETDGVIINYDSWLRGMNKEYWESLTRFQPFGSTYVENVRSMLEIQNLYLLKDDKRNLRNLECEPYLGESVRKEGFDFMVTGYIDSGLGESYKILIGFTDKMVK